MRHFISILAALLPHNQTPKAQKRIADERLTRLAARTSGHHHNDGTHWSGHLRMTMKAVKQEIAPDYTKTSVVAMPRKAAVRRKRPVTLGTMPASTWQNAEQVHDTLTHPHVYVLEAASA